jgi:hypothetical protein
LARYLQQRSSGLKNLQVQLTSESQADVIEVFLTWHSSYSYWAPTFAMSQVEQLEFGFAVLDYRVRKAILACHKLKERDEIAKLLAAGFGVRFSALVLTKPVLEQIGRFDNVKRALYAINKPDPATPANITYPHSAACSVVGLHPARDRGLRCPHFFPNAAASVSLTLRKESRRNPSAASRNGATMFGPPVPWPEPRGKSRPHRSRMVETVTAGHRHCEDHCAYCAYWLTI